MFKTYLERIKDAGVVGAGGAGFPTYVKIDAAAEVIIANGAECEPLLRVDQQIMDLYAERIIKGIKVVMKTSGAGKAVICLKSKYKSAVRRLNEAIAADGSGKKISLHTMESFYPAGDEQQMIYEATGKVVPLGGLPKDVGAIVVNVNTLLNIASAVDGTPVTHKYVTVTGEVDRPVTLNAPIGMAIRELIALAGGPTDPSKYALVMGGPMMGYVENDWSARLTKTTGGIIVLPKDHYVVRKKTESLERDYKQAKAICCQCNFCSQLCPRSSLGLGVSPHQVMRTIGYGNAENLGNLMTVFGCSGCGICTYFACPMDLNPSRMVGEVKNALAAKGIKPEKHVPNDVSDAYAYKKVPTGRLIQRLQLKAYDVPAEMVPEHVPAEAVRIPLKQHIGAPAVPVVAEGDYVTVGQPIGQIPDGQLGAAVHASISGRVLKAADGWIEIQRTEGGAP